MEVGDVSVSASSVIGVWCDAVWRRERREGEASQWQNGIRGRKVKQWDEKFYFFFYSLVQYEKSHDIDPFLVLCQSKEKCETMNIFWIVYNLTGLFRNPGCHHCPLTLHSSTFACSVGERRVSMSHPSTSDQLWESKHKRKGRSWRRGVYQGKEERDRGGEYQKSEEGGGSLNGKGGGGGDCAHLRIFDNLMTKVPHTAKEF